MHPEPTEDNVVWVRFKGFIAWGYPHIGACMSYVTVVAGFNASGEEAKLLEEIRRREQGRSQDSAGVEALQQLLDRPGLNS